MTFDGTLTICGKPFFEQETTTSTATGVHLPLQTAVIRTENKNGHVRTYQIIKPEDYKI